MITTMDYTSELISIQNEIKKAIYRHQVIQFKINRKPTDNLEIESKNVQKKIIQLSERQKLILGNLRKNRPNFDRKAYSINGQLAKFSQPILVNNTQNLLKRSNQDGSLKISNQPLALRTIGGQTKLLIPVSAAAATSKKTNQQILVVPTPGGGARLATASAASRASLVKSFVIENNVSNNNNFNFNNSNSNLNKSNIYSILHGHNNFVSVNNISSSNNNKNNNNTNNNNNDEDNDNNNDNDINSNTNTTNNNSNNNDIDTSNNNLDNSDLNNSNSKIISSKVVFNDNSNNNETSSKKKLSVQVQPIEKVVTVKKDKEEQKVLETKEKEDFFAALGLVTKKALSEIQNKKCERKRRTTANPQFSNAAIEAKRISALELAAKKAKKRELAASNNQPDDRLQQSKVPNKVFLSTNRNKVINNRNNTEKKPQTVPKITSKTFNQNFANKIKISQNCFICDELCDSDLDAIMFCKDCRCLFHVTCSSTIDTIKKTMGVPCPKCEKKRSLNDEISPNFANSVMIEDDMIIKNLSNLGDNTEIIRNNTVSNVNKRKLNRGKNLSNNHSNLKRFDHTTKTNKLSKDTNKKAKAFEEKEKLIIKQISLSKQIKDYQNKLSELKDKIQLSDINREEILQKREYSKKSIEVLINFVRRIKNQLEQKENCMEEEKLFESKEKKSLNQKQTLIEDIKMETGTINNESENIMI